MIVLEDRHRAGRGLLPAAWTVLRGWRRGPRRPLSAGWMARRYAHLSGTGVLEFYKSFDDFAFKAKDPKEGFAVQGATGKVQPPAGDMRPETLFVSALTAAATF